MLQCPRENAGWLQGRETVLLGGKPLAQSIADLPCKVSTACRLPCLVGRTQDCALNLSALKAHYPTLHFTSSFICQASVSSTGQSTEASLSLQLSTEARHSPATSQSSSWDKASQHSVGSRSRASAATGKRKMDGHGSQSQKQQHTDLAGSWVMTPVMHGTFQALCWLTPQLQADGAACLFSKVFDFPYDV